MSAALAKLEPVRVEDWILFAGGADFWLRDLDLAERAGLRVPRDIRRTIKKVIDEGALPTIVGGAHDGPLGSVGGAHATNAPGGPLVRVERTLVPKGDRGGSQEVDEYYLNEEAALFIVTRLRTKMAIQLTRAVIRVFVMVCRGEAPAAPPVVEPAGLLERLAALEALAAQQGAALTALHGPPALPALQPRAPLPEHWNIDNDRRPFVDVNDPVRAVDVLLPLLRAEAASPDGRLGRVYFDGRARRVFRVFGNGSFPLKTITMQEWCSRLARWVKYSAKGKPTLLPNPTTLIARMLIEQANLWAPVTRPAEKVVLDPWEQPIRHFLDVGEVPVVTSRVLLSEVLKVEHPSQAAFDRVGDIMQRLGYTNRRGIWDAPA